MMEWSLSEAAFTVHARTHTYTPFKFKYLYVNTCCASVICNISTVPFVNKLPERKEVVLAMSMNVQHTPSITQHYNNNSY